MPLPVTWLKVLGSLRPGVLLASGGSAWIGLTSPLSPLFSNRGKHVHMRVYRSIYACVHMSMYVLMCGFFDQGEICTYACVYMYMSIYACVHMSVYVLMCRFFNQGNNVHMRVYICNYVCTCTYVYVCVDVWVLQPRRNMYICVCARVPDANGISQACYIVEIDHSGPEPSNYVPI